MLYEHCRRATCLACSVWPQARPTSGNGGWSDGFNGGSTGGRGVSVWLAWFLIRVCTDFAPICTAQGDPTLASKYSELARNLRECVETSGWDGDWYRRAYYDDGTPLGRSEEHTSELQSLMRISYAVFCLKKNKKTTTNKKNKNN